MRQLSKMMIIFQFALVLIIALLSLALIVYNLVYNDMATEVWWFGAGVFAVLIGALVMVAYFDMKDNLNE